MDHYDINDHIATTIVQHSSTHGGSIMMFWYLTIKPALTGRLFNMESPSVQRSVVYKSVI